MTTVVEREPVALDRAQQPLAAEAAKTFEQFLADKPGRAPELTLPSEAGDTVTVSIPEAALRLLVDILENLAQGNAVSVIPYHTELTTQQAADILNVSRPFLVKLLDEGAIGHRKVGKHRRVLFRDLIAYKHSERAQRREAARELTELSQELGLYEEDATTPEPGAKP